MRKTTFAWVSPLALLAALALAGCGGGGGGGGGGSSSSSNSNSGGDGAALSLPSLRVYAGDVAGPNAGDFLSWTPAVDSSGAVITYDVYRATKSNLSDKAKIISALSTAPTAAAPYQDAGAVPVNGSAIPYYYQVIANAANASSVSSNLGSATPGGPTSVGLGDPAGNSLPNLVFQDAVYSLTTSAANPTVIASNKFVLDLTLDYAAAATDLKSVQYKGTLYTAANTPGFANGITVNAANDELKFDSQAAGITLPVAYDPIQAAGYYSLTATVATSTGAATTASLEQTGLATASSAAQPSKNVLTFPQASPLKNRSFEMDVFNNP